MFYAGIDLSADPANTGVARLRDEGALFLIDATLSAPNPTLTELITTSTAAGVDVPLGWPRAFREVLDAHARPAHPAPVAQSLEATAVGTGSEWRRSVVNRFTDLRVREVAGVVPLPVAAERIAYPALRWAAIEAGLRADGVAVDRSGVQGPVVEVYPAAALKLWGLPHRGYKGGAGGAGGAAAKDVDAKGAAARAARAEIIAGLRDRFELDFGPFEKVCADSADVLDAVIAALVAREARHGRCIPPPTDEGLAGLVAEEGWIWIPEPGAVGGF